MRLRRSCLLPLLAVFCVACSNAGTTTAERDGAVNSSSAAHRLSRPSGPVLDAANLLPPSDEAKLSDRLTRLYEQRGLVLVVVTTPNLGGEDIADYTKELANRWKVGDRGRANGVVLLVAPNERKVRIATGEDIRKRLSDAIPAGIIEQRILPHFRRGAMAAGIEDGVDALVEAMKQSTL